MRAESPEQGHPPVTFSAPQASRPLRILIVSQWFDPEPACRGMSFAKALLERGHSVTVLTGFPNYPHGKLYDGFKQQFLHREMTDGVLLLRVPLYISHDTNPVKRAMNYLSFMVSAASIGLFRVPAFDVAYIYHPPITTALAGAFICKLRRKSYVVDIQDLWPESVLSTGMLDSPRLNRMLGWACDIVYRHADSVSVISDGVRNILIDRGVPVDKLHVIGNWCEERMLRFPVENEDNVKYLVRFKDRFTIAFAGNMGQAQNLDIVIDAALEANRIDDRIHFLFIGDGTQRKALQKRCDVEEITCVSFVPQLPMAEVGTLLRQADALLVHLSDLPLFEITIPSKTQAAMAISKPVLMAVRGEAAELIERCGCGVTAMPDDSKCIARAALQLAAMGQGQLDAMGQKALHAYESMFAKSSGVNRFEALFLKALNRTTPHG